MTVNSVFEEDWWLNIVAPNCWKEIIIEKEGTKLGRFVYCEKRKILGKRIYMPLLTQTLGFSFDLNVNESNTLSFQKDCINEVLNKFKPLMSCDLCLDVSNYYVLPYLWKRFFIKPRFTYRITNLLDINCVYNNFSNTVKKNIKRAQKKVYISNEVRVDYLKSMIIETYKIQHRHPPFPLSLIEKIVQEASSRNSGRMFTALDEVGNIHACSFVVYNSNVCHALLGGSNPKYRNSGAKSLIWFEAIKFASTVSKEFDFEGSMIESIEQFVRQFGGKPTVYYNVVKKTMLELLFDYLKPYIKYIIGYKQ